MRKRIINILIPTFFIIFVSKGFGQTIPYGFSQDSVRVVATNMITKDTFSVVYQLN